MRGDRPQSSALSRQKFSFTPHARGSTSPEPSPGRPPTVYPACAGIDLKSCRTIPAASRLPRMRGDRPVLFAHQAHIVQFTPHARGSTLFTLVEKVEFIVYPACAGIDLLASGGSRRGYRLPRMRGDRPRMVVTLTDEQRFTPHARGSTFAIRVVCEYEGVYPACAGIDLFSAVKNASTVGLPRMRGDRPQPPPTACNLRSFTPHARGSTLARFD